MDKFPIYSLRIKEFSTIRGIVTKQQRKKGVTIDR